MNINQYDVNNFSKNLNTKSPCLFFYTVWQKLSLCVLFSFVAFSCSQAPPALAKIKFQLWDQVNPNTKVTNHFLSLWYTYSEAQIKKHIQHVYVLNNPSGMYWDISPEIQASQSTSAQTWYGYNWLTLGLKQPLPIGHYRVIVADYSGQSSQKDFTIEKDNTCPLPVHTIKINQNTISVFPPIKNYIVTFFSNPLSPHMPLFNKENQNRIQRTNIFFYINQLKDNKLSLLAQNTQQPTLVPKLNSPTHPVLKNKFLWIYAFGQHWHWSQKKNDQNIPLWLLENPETLPNPAFFSNKKEKEKGIEQRKNVQTNPEQQVQFNLWKDNKTQLYLLYLGKSCSGGNVYVLEGPFFYPQ